MELSATDTVSPANTVMPQHISAVAWSAVLAGAVAIAVLSLILLILGTGLGFTIVSPWLNQGVSAATLGVSAILWLSFTQILASGMGGFIAGRLRTKWVGVHSDEVYFRDTVHGFLAWGVASLATAMLLLSVIGSILSGGFQAGASVLGKSASATAEMGTAVMNLAAGNAGAPTGDNSAAGYFVESMFRSEAESPATDNSRFAALPLSEASHIFMQGIANEELPEPDLRYVAQLISRNTDLTTQEAETRASAAFTELQTTLQEAEAEVKATADAVKRASAYTSLWVFVSLLIGAFTASFSATLGGRFRDA